MKTKDVYICIYIFQVAMFFKMGVYNYIYIYIYIPPPMILEYFKENHLECLACSSGKFTPQGSNLRLKTLGLSLAF